MKFKIITLSFLSIFTLSCSKNTPQESEQHKDTITPVKMSASENSDRCFKLEANKNFVFDDDETEINIATTTFNGQNAMAIIKQKNGVRTDYIYDLTGRTLLANLDYGIAALGSNPDEVLVTTTYQAPLPTFPSQLKPQQKFQMTYKSILESQLNDEKIENNQSTEMKFIGFENLKMVDNDDKILDFKNVCHFETQLDDHKLDEWYAEGYGQIKFIKTNSDGEIVSSESIGMPQ